MGRRRPGMESGQGLFPKILLLGNPQVGKTCLRAQLAAGNLFSLHSEGDPTELGRSCLWLEGQVWELIDPPGVHSLLLDTEEASLVKRVLWRESPSLALLVADAKNLKRGLMLYLETMELGLPLVMALNMSDEARQRGIWIDVRSLSSRLGIEICLTSAAEGEGIMHLRRLLLQAHPPSSQPIYPFLIQQGLEELGRELCGEPHPRFLSLLLLAGDREAWRYVSGRYPEALSALSGRVEAIQGQFGLPLSVVMAEARLRRAEELRRETVRIEAGRGVPWGDRIDRWLRAPLSGLLFLVLVFIAFYLWVGRFGAGVLGSLLKERLFDGQVIPWLNRLLHPLAFPFLEEILLGPFGLISMGLSSTLGLILPVLGTFFLALALLEDSGYLSRLGILSHRLLRKVGLQGKAVLTMFLGLSCVTMATLTTRFLESKKERLIATFLLALGIPCSAQLSLIFALSPSLSLSALLFAFFILASVQLGAGMLAQRLVPGAASDFMMELFPLRIPRLRDLLLKTYYRLAWFLREALPLFLLGTLILFLSNEVGLLYLIERISRPVVSGIFGLPPETAEAFMMGFLRKEGAVPILKGMVDGGRLSSVQTMLSLVLTTLFVPCASTVLVMLKEQGLRTTLIVLAAILGTCLAVGGILNFGFQLLRLRF